MLFFTILAKKLVNYGHMAGDSVNTVFDLKILGLEITEQFNFIFTKMIWKLVVPLSIGTFPNLFSKTLSGGSSGGSRLR